MTDEEKAEEENNVGISFKKPYKESELESLIRQDVENGTFHAQNIFSDEYLKPQFYKYVKKLEEENEQLREKLKKISDYLANEIPHELMNEATNKIWKLV